MPVSPHNILIRGGIASLKKSKLVSAIFGVDNYVIRELPSEDKRVWLEHTRVLVVADAVNLADDQKLIEQFLQKGGHLLSLTGKFTCGIRTTGDFRVEEKLRLSYGSSRDVEFGHGVSRNEFRLSDVPSDRRLSALVDGRFVSNCGDVQQTVTSSVLRVDFVNSGGIALLCQIDDALLSPAALTLLRELVSTELGLVCHPPADIQYSPGYILGRKWSRDEVDIFVCSANVKLRVVCPDSGDSDASDSCSAKQLVLWRDCTPDRQRWDSELYFSGLLCRQLGQRLLYVPKLRSSMDLLHARACGPPDGTIVVVDRQTGGRGRAGSRWLSPVGCCMFSLLLRLPLKVGSGPQISWLQHLAALAVCQAVHTLSTCPSSTSKTRPPADLRIKWPNDLYWRREFKLGGVVVETSCMGPEAVCCIGVGLNLDNELPTACLNRLLEQPLRRETLVAVTLNKLESLLSLHAKGGHAAVSKSYYQYWLHGDESIAVSRATVVQDAVIVGVDKYGFLQVRFSDGALETVCPDGNSFDLMRGMIVPKMS